MLWQLGRPRVGVHEGRVRLHEQLVQGYDALLQDLPHPVLRLVLPEVAGQPDVAAELEVAQRLLPRPREAVDHARRQPGAAGGVT